MKKTQCGVLILFAARLLAQGVPAGAHNFRWNSGSFTGLDLKHTIAKDHQLNRAERAALVKSITVQLRNSIHLEDAVSEREMRQIALNSRLRFVDLNEDGVPEIIVQPVGVRTGCGATGNCPFWVFSKVEQGFKLLLGFAGELYRIEPGVNGGYHDIAIAARDSASEKQIYVYRYAGNKYLQVECYDAWWTDSSGGKFRVLKQPSITRCRLK